MLSNKNKYILYITLLYGVLTVILFTKGNEIFKFGVSITGIAVATTAFFIYELFVIFFTESKSKTFNSRQTINLFLGFKVGKIILSLLFLSIYAMTVKMELKRFIGAFLVLYLIFLIFETAYLLNREKNLKKSQNEETEKRSNYFNK